MKTKASSTARSLTEETERPAERRVEDGHEEEDHADHSAQTFVAVAKLKKGESDLKKALGRGPDRDLEDSKFLELVEDPKFNRMLDQVCKQAVREYRPGPAYSWEDLRSDLFLKFGLWLWQYKGEASYKSLLRRMAVNQLIDKHRNRNERCCSFEELELDEDNVRPLHARADADAQEHVQVREWMSKLKNERERDLFSKHVLEGMSASDIARERGISRQAAAKQIKHMLGKLRPYV